MCSDKAASCEPMSRTSFVVLMVERQCPVSPHSRRVVMRSQAGIAITLADGHGLAQ
jgi:hypothetical protein